MKEKILVADYMCNIFPLKPSDFSKILKNKYQVVTNKLDRAFTKKRINLSC